MNQLINKVTNYTLISIEDRAELMLIALFNFLDNLFNGTDSYSEKKEQVAEKMIIDVFTYFEMLFDDEQDQLQAESA